MKCRHCYTDLRTTVLDLGSAPPSNSYLSQDKLHCPEIWYPLRLLVCESCWLVQIEDYTGREQLFDSDYAYFSSYSTTWLTHAKQYVEQMRHRFSLESTSQVVEIAANDGYLLQFVQAAQIPCYGIEPTASTANAARQKGIEIIEKFFGVELAQKLSQSGKSADLMIANNVLAHVPDINDFVKGFTLLLKPNGVATFEFPHLLKLVTENQFDTIYHEHYSYLSLTAVIGIFNKNGLDIFDVDEIKTHGGSLRVYAQRRETGQNKKSVNVEKILRFEADMGLLSINYYSGFQEKANRVKNEFLSFLLETKRQGKRVVAYGAAAKGNTMMNYAGIRPDLITFVADQNPAKQGKYMPGSRIPIVSEAMIKDFKPDYVILLPWNLRDEISKQLEYIKRWSGRHVVVVPKLEVL